MRFARPCFGALVRGVLFLAPMKNVYAEESAKDVIEDVAALCPAAVLRPDTLTDKLAERHFLRKDAALAAPKWLVTMYQHEGSQAALQLSERTFSDATIHLCLFTAQTNLSFDDVAALKAKLEADPDIRDLEGEPGRLPQGNVRLGWFKRPGNDPTLYLNVTATDRFVSVTMSRTDFHGKVTGPLPKGPD